MIKESMSSVKRLRGESLREGERERQREREIEREGRERSGKAAGSEQ